MSVLTTAEPVRLDSFATPPGPVRRFSVAEYHHLIDAGFFTDGERFELLEGWIVPKMRQTPRHAVAIDLIQDALRSRVPEGWHLRLQSALTSGESEPEPDLAVVRDQPRDYLNRHPGPEDVALIVEVADSSLAQDRTWKARIYARGGVPAYWVVNLVEGVVEVYSGPSGPGTEPAYQFCQTVRPGEVLPLNIGGQAIGQLAVADLLP